MHILYQLQLSNIVKEKFVLSCDSNWNIFKGRLREILKVPYINVTVIVPKAIQIEDFDTSFYNLLDDVGLNINALLKRIIKK